jgi:hypothetical protein
MKCVSIIEITIDSVNSKRVNLGKEAKRGGLWFASSSLRRKDDGAHVNSGLDCLLAGICGIFPKYYHEIPLRQKVEPITALLLSEFLWPLVMNW